MTNRPDAQKPASSKGVDSEANTDKPTTVTASAFAPKRPEDPTPTVALENPCTQERPVRLTLIENVPENTPFGIRVAYLGGGHKIFADREGGRTGDLPYYEFIFRKEKRRADYRKTADDWREAENFQGICWRGAGKAKWHPKSVTIELAPMCTDEGELVKRGCGGAFRKKTE